MLPKVAVPRSLVRQPAPVANSAYAALSRGSAISVDAEGASGERHHIEESACHHQIFVEMEHVGGVADRQVDAKGCAEAEQGSAS